MTVVAVQRYEGDVAEHLRRYRVANSLLTHRGPAEGVLSHLCYATPDALVIVNVWVDEGAARAAGRREDFRSALARAGMTYVEPEFFPVVQHTVH